MAIFLKAKWENIIMANYAIDPKILEPYLPKGVALDFYNGQTFVSLVGFMFKNTKLFNIPIPYLGTFEEVNLRFYVTRKEGNETKRGVVFINETIPYKLVAWMANKLYKEHYTTIPTKHEIKVSENSKHIKYEWLKDNNWNSIDVGSTVNCASMQDGSLEQFILEHYYGYTKINENATEEYKLHHPSWKINAITKCNINCNFESMYGADFAVLQTTQPTNVCIAEGSHVAIEWKRNRLKF
jgi:uncharacterized protein YqjF (DUF2071 family)